MIEKYIATCKGKATLNKVVDYMDFNEEVPSKLRTSRMTTLRLINELEKGGRIKILKGERQGQSHRLSINNNSEFKEINQQISKLEGYIDRLKIVKKIEEPRKHKGHISVSDEEFIFMHILMTLVRINLLPFEKDSQILYRKIIRLMTALALKKIRSMKKEGGYLESLADFKQAQSIRS